MLKSRDFLKGLAIIMVIFVHSPQAIPNVRGIADIVPRLGQLGCQLFLVISAFTLCISFDKNGNWLKFYKKRLLNIVPGWYTMIAFWYIANVIAQKLFHYDLYLKTNMNWKDVLCNVLFLNGVSKSANNNVVFGGWYIGTTMLFYLIFPFIFLVCKYYKNKTNNLRGVMFLEIVLWCICFWLICQKEDKPYIMVNNSFWYFNICNQLSCLLWGFGLFYTWKERIAVKYLLLKTLIAGIVTTILFYSEMSLAFIFVPMISGVLFYYVILWVENKISFQLKIVCMIQEMGRVSFAAFLIHPLFVWALPHYVVLILEYFKIPYQPTVVWSVLLIPIYVMTYFAAVVFQKYLKKLERIID